ncbi:MAG: 16S rRNA (uracil(1498)-N(3))-methyltransferase [Cyanobacteria bacterium]|nr:16S rRNA (uracil(1498)-N(3))-methyltransferase [Cyanobacteriota bacterium]
MGNPLIKPPRRFFLEHSLIETHEGLYHCDDDFLVGHIKQVLRLKAGQSLQLIDPEKAELLDVILESYPGKHTARFTLEKKTLLTELIPPAQPTVVLASALLKKTAWEWLLEKATELGVTRIIPLQTTHTVVDPSKDKEETSLSRWRSIIRRASEQCERLVQPVCAPLCTLDSLLSESQDNTNVPLLTFALIERYPEQTEPDNRQNLIITLEKALQKSTKAPTIILMVGPEGGWHPDEQRRLSEQAGVIPISLGKAILKSETASISGLSVINQVLQQVLQLS